MLSNYYAELQYEYGITCKVTCKRYNNNYRAISRTINTRNVLIECRQQKILPTFIINRTKNLIPQTNTNDGAYGRIVQLIHKTNKHILNFEISHINRKIKYLKQKSKNLHNKLFRLAPQHIVNKFINNIRNPSRFSKTLKTEQNDNKLTNKLNKLIQQQTPHISYNKDWLKNLSSIQIPEDVNMILSLGPKFAVGQLKNEIPVNKIIADVEQIIPSFNEKENHNIIRGRVASIISQHLQKSKHLNNRKQLILHKA